MLDNGKNILIAGGAGFLGSHMCDRYLEDGWSVVAVDNLCTGRISNFSQFALRHKRFLFMDFDIMDPLCFAVIAGTNGRLIDSRPFDAVLHLASPASPVDYQEMPVETMTAGSTGTKNLLDCAADDGAVFLLASTSEVYGDPLVSPQPEEYWGNVNPIGPRSMYDEAKRYAEALTATYYRTGRVPNIRIARIFNTYGPRMQATDGRVIPNFINQAIRGQPLTVYGGEQTRSFCFFSDTVEGLVRLLDSEETRPVNIGNPSEISILRLARIISDLTGQGMEYTRSALPEDDPRRRCPDISRAIDILGWKPKVDLAAGLQATLAYFKECRGDISEAIFDISEAAA